MTVKLDKLFSEEIALNIKSLSYISNYKTDIELWTSSIAELELGEAAKQLFVTVLELRSLDCNDLVRFQIIQQLDQNLKHLLRSLEQHYLNNSLLDTKRDQQISELVLEIKSHHALIYCDIFNRIHHHLCHHNFSLFEFNLKKKLNVLRKKTAIAAIKCLNSLFYSLQLLYSDAPKRFWSTAYSIYQTARSYHFHLDKIEQDHTQNAIDSIEKALIQLILMSILNHHKLRQTEIKDLMLCISHWTSLISITEQSNDHSQYFVDYSSDCAPQLYFSDHQHQEQHIYIDVHDLNAYIDSTLKPHANYHSKAEEKALTNVLKHHIQNILHLNPERISPRYAEKGIINVALGITSAHFFLSHAKHFKETLQLDTDLSLQNTPKILSNLSTDNEIKLSSHTLEQRFNAEMTKIYPVDVVNRSKTGYGLQWHQQPPKNLRTGEFILVKESPHHCWTGAIIRWMKNNVQHQIDFGIELFSPDMYPAAVALQKNLANAIYHPAIIMVDDNDELSLILPSAQIFYENQTLYLRFSDIDLKIFLKNSIILTQNCAKFNFDFLEQSKKSLLKQHFQKHIATLKTQDLWESLK